MEGYRSDMTTSLLFAGIVYLSKRVKGDIDTLGLLLQPAMSLNIKSKQKDMCACKHVYRMLL